VNDEKNDVKREVRRMKGGEEEIEVGTSSFRSNPDRGIVPKNK